MNTIKSLKLSPSRSATYNEVIKNLVQVDLVLIMKYDINNFILLAGSQTSLIPSQGGAWG